ncbi:MAG: SMP-30/gluconolactonase/LRE family protein [Phycisphaerales bacterium]|nr:SMP-30/gluconolactonase/LRE family protein [Phycisphaerales bacterium]
MTHLFLRGIAAAALLSSVAWAQDDIIGFDSDRWDLAEADVVTHLGRTCLVGSAYITDAEFTNGVIDVDIAVDGSRSYPGIVFRVQPDGNCERFYIRPHRAGLYPDALQYTPVFGGVACWQLHHGDGFTASARFPIDQWFHLKMEICGTQARVFINDADEPALVIHDLKQGRSTGSVGLVGPRNGTAWFSNFRYTADDSLEFDDPPTIVAPEHVITEWEVSRVVSASRVDPDQYPPFFFVFAAQWQPVEAEPTGLVNLSKHIQRTGQEPDCVFARTIFRSDEERDIELTFGYSDDVTIFLNGKKVFSGASAYRSRDPSFLGIVGWNDAVRLHLRKGLNEILLTVTESFGGWGFMCKTDRDLAPPIKEHSVAAKVWETPDVFKIPESVLYDPKRDVLYVSSFNKVYTREPRLGFISRVGLDGEILEIEWVTDLDGPCGMGIHENTLYVVECSGNLVAIDIEAGRIAHRYPIDGVTFLNDLAINDDGYVYISDTTRPPEGRDIIRFKDGEWEVWKDGWAIQRANGLFVHGDRLLVGSTGDGMLKSIDMVDGRVTEIVSLGAGVVDGIRVDNQGNYLVSHWEGQTYRISPTGDVVEILDTLGDGLNSADFEFIKDRNLLVIPTFLGNKVVAYRLDEG